VVARRFVPVDELPYYRTHFLEAVRDDGVVCLEFGAVRKALPQHVHAHGLTADAYRARWGYNRNNPLTIPATSAKRRQVALIHLVASGPPDAIRKAQAARSRLSSSVRPEARLQQRAIQRARAAGGRPHNQRIGAATLRTLVGEDLTIREIAGRTGLHPMNVAKRLRRLGLAARPARPRKITDAQLLALREAGRWLREIAAQTGMTVGGLRDRLRRLRRQGVAVPVPARPRPNPQRRVGDAELLALAQAGLRAPDIARRVGLTRVPVYVRLRRLRLRGLLPPARNRGEGRSAGEGARAQRGARARPVINPFVREGDL
jgi:DNA-binding Lrp family transcriptional regulator